MMARASATRWRWPPESSLGRRSEQAVELDAARHLGHHAPALIVGHLADLQRIADVVVDRQVRVERVGLEDHGDVAVFGQDVVDAILADIDIARGYLFEARDHAHGRGLAAAGGAEQHQKLLVDDLEVEVGHGDEAAEFLDDVVEP